MIQDSRDAARTCVSVSAPWTVEDGDITAMPLSQLYHCGDCVKALGWESVTVEMGFLSSVCEAGDVSAIEAYCFSSHFSGLNVALFSPMGRLSGCEWLFRPYPRQKITPIFVWKTRGPSAKIQTSVNVGKTQRSRCG